MKKPIFLIVLLAVGLPISGYAKPKMVVQLVAESTDSSALGERIFIVLPDGSHATAECWLGMHSSCGIDAFRPEKRITKSCHSASSQLAADCYVGETYYATRKGNDITIYAANGERIYHITGSWDSFEDYPSHSPATSGGITKATVPAQELAAADSKQAEYIAALKEQAANGDSNAQIMLADHYLDGDGVPKDYAKMMEWLRKAAEQGNAKAQEALGMIYGSDEVMPHDYQQSAVWWSKAAAQGNAEAQHTLGSMFWAGLGVPKDYIEAVVWFRKSAEQGNSDGQLELGRAYYNGEGVPQDYAQAAIWYHKAAEQGDADAQLRMGGLFSSGIGVTQDWAESYFWFYIGALGKQNTFKPEDVAQYRDSAASHLKKAELLRTKERAGKWFEDHPANVK